MFPSLGEGTTPARCLQLSQTHMCILYYGACTASTDHRGTKEYPGRTVTLEPKEGVITWGVAYRISGHDEESLVLSYLDLREREYDVRAYLDFFTVESSVTPAIKNVLVYIGSQNRMKNRFYLGPAPLEDMASQIAKAVGPAGPNYEYLFRLEEALGEIGKVLS
jgi:cation transport regulator ChaC